MGGIWSFGASRICQPDAVAGHQAPLCGIDHTSFTVTHNTCSCSRVVVWQGRPIYIQHLGAINVKRIYELTTEERTLRFHVQEYERCARYIMPACSLAAGHHIDTTFAIIDLKGALTAPSSPCLPAAQIMSTISMDACVSPCWAVPGCRLPSTMLVHDHLPAALSALYSWESISPWTPSLQSPSGVLY